MYFQFFQFQYNMNHKTQVLNYPNLKISQIIQSYVILMKPHEEVLLISPTPHGGVGRNWRCRKKELCKINIKTWIQLKWAFLLAPPQFLLKSDFYLEVTIQDERQIGASSPKQFSEQTFQNTFYVFQNKTFWNKLFLQCIFSLFFFLCNVFLHLFLFSSSHDGSGSGQL